MASTVYAGGSLAVLLVAVVLVVGACRLRARLLPGWTGAPARLAEVVMVLAVPFAVAQAVGTFGWFARYPMLIGCLVAGAGMTLLGRDGGRVPAADRAGAPRRMSSRTRPEELVATVAATAAVGAQWAMHTAYALDRGMTHGDTLWYHGPFAARFVQTGHLTYASHTGLEDLASPLHGALPLNGSLAHAILILPYGHDVLSPLVNLGFFVVALLAGWCIGARSGVGPLALLATVAIVGLPTLTGTQPGQASNDIVSGALFFAGIALLFEGSLRPAPTALAGVAAGLALGTKLTVLAPLAIVTVGVVFLAVRARRATTAVAWCLALFLSGGYWLVRNWIVLGNPVPWSRVSLGPFGLDRAIDSRPALITILDRSETWDRFIFPGLRDALGWAWVVVLVLVVAGAIAGIVRAEQGVERVAGLSAVVGICALPFIPFSADFGGGIFVFMVRYLLPEFLVGAALLVLVVARAPLPWRRTALLAFAVVVVSDVTSSYIEGAPLWPPGQAATGLLTAAAVVAGAIALVRRRTLGATPNRAAVAVVTGVVFVAVLGFGWVVQRTYLDHRYVSAGLPHDRVNAWFREVRDARVAALGREHFYPLFGADLSNRVSRVTVRTDGSDAQQCRRWRRSLQNYDYVVLGADPISSAVPLEQWIADDPAASLVLRDGREAVFRVDGSLDPSTCV